MGFKITRKWFRGGAFFLHFRISSKSAMNLDFGAFIQEKGPEEMRFPLTPCLDLDAPLQGATLICLPEFSGRRDCIAWSREGHSSPE